MADIEILEELRDKDPDALGGNTPDEVRGKTPEQLHQLVEILDAHLRSLHQDEDTGEIRDLSVDEDRAFRYGLKVREAAIKRIEEHRALTEVFTRRPKAVKTAMNNIRYGLDDVSGVTRMPVAEARDMALRKLDERFSTRHMSADEKDEVERQVRTSTDIARRILVTENDAYRNAWLKMVTRPNAAYSLDDEERHALMAWDEYRTMSEGTTTAGGFGIPVKLAA